jgi:hypothetical protein
VATKPIIDIPGVPSPLEHAEQSAFFARVASMLVEYPWLGLMHAIPNGGLRPSKSVVRRGRHIRVCTEGKKLKDEGVKDGVPDIHLPAPRGIYHGLYIEAKRMPYRAANGKIVRQYPSPEQKHFIDGLRALGHKVEVCEGADAMFKTLVDYINLGPFYWADF